MSSKQSVDPKLDPLGADFRNFLFAIWRHLGLPAPTDLQYDVGVFLASGPRRRVIQAFRGFGKSFITAAYVLWRLYRDPNERILVVSANEERAVQFTTFVKRLISECELLAHLRADREGRDSALAFDVGGSRPHQSPSVRAAGIFGQITGSRASVIVADDVEVPKNSLTQTMRDRLSEAIKEFDAVLMTAADLAAIGLPTSEIVYLGTPQTEGSIYNLLPARGYTTRIWPARYPNEKQRAAYNGQLAPFIEQGLAADKAGKPTEPLRFSERELLERELSYGKAGFALQFMLDTSLADVDRYPLKLQDLIVMPFGSDMAPAKVVWGSGKDQLRDDLPSVGLAGDRWYRPMFYTEKDFQPFQGVVMAIDPAGRGGDELAYAVVAMLNGFLYVLDVRGLRNGYEDGNLEYLARTAKKWGVRHIIVEENFGDGMFSKLLTPFLARIHPVTMEEVKHSIQKEKRIIDTLEPVMSGHRLIVNEALVKQDVENYNGYATEVAHRYQLFYQMTRITRDKQSLAKDDRIDVLAMAVAYWSEQMDRDVTTIEADRKEELRDQEFDKFMEACFPGHVATGTSWTDSILS